MNIIQNCMGQRFKKIQEPYGILMKLLITGVWKYQCAGMVPNSVYSQSSDKYIHLARECSAKKKKTISSAYADSRCIILLPMPKATLSQGPQPCVDS